MKRYLLDTAPMAVYLQKKEPAVSLIRPLIEKHEVATSIVVYAEVTEYISSHPKFPQSHYELRQLLREIYPYFLTYPILDRYADISERFVLSMVKG
jgi:hypothetical protein